MLIKEQVLRHWIDNFYGYGSWQTPIWFIGYEESGGELPEEVAEKINYFHEAHPSNTGGSLCDVRELYRRVAFRWDGPNARSYATRYEYRFGANAVQNNIWKNLTAFVHGYRNKPLPDLLEYQQQTFASPNARNEALMQLYPLPSPHNHAWYYSWLDIPTMSFLKSRGAYQEHVYQRRIDTLLGNIKTYKPEVVLMYGMTNINALKTSVQESFPDAKFKLIKSTKLQIPQHHLADIDGTTLLITTQIPALRHNRVETGFDWEEMGKRVKGSV